MFKLLNLKSVLLSLLVMMVTVVAVGGIIELAVRHFYPEYNPAGTIEFYKSPLADSLYFGEPNSVQRQFNPMGDFDVEIRFDKWGYRSNRDLQAAQTEDFIAVGDSFTFGHGVEYDKRFTSLLEKDLGVNIFNLGIPGNFDAYEDHLNFVRSLGVKAKKIFVAVCMENDLFMYGTEGGKGHITLQSYGGTSRLQSFKWFMTKHSALYHWVVTIVHSNLSLASLVQKFHLQENPVQYIEKAKDTTEELVEKSAQRLLRLYQRNDVRFVVLIPSRLVYGNNPAELLIHQKFAERLRQLGINVVDLLPAAQQLPSPANLHFPHDGHWNEQGHRLAADEIGKWIREHKLIFSQNADSTKVEK